MEKCKTCGAPLMRTWLGKTYCLNWTFSEKVAVRPRHPDNGNDKTLGVIPLDRVTADELLLLDSPEIDYRRREVLIDLSIPINFIHFFNLAQQPVSQGEHDSIDGIDISHKIISLSPPAAQARKED